ncbi:MAG: 30S ribosome-binding factor RbfA [Eubacteriales bacterium]|nr:30S ribosome-binding factor RbfA [Eubacteriales bacterium]MDD3198957.1 30S ribosome-binding factor RbfA [Eubacteriales bacterium]MDD4122277.1 30S ribosome-binding factor RbfA [Eubacteriales bacterium]MDD4629557.1 30S ribosome-binding factor RbfA [Eubacteriales bacterium]
MGKGYRQGRLGEEIRRIVSELLIREIKDPRLSGIVTVSAVDVTEDGSYATIYITKLGSDVTEETGDDEKNDVLTAFKSAKGLIRREIGRQIKLRHVPDLSFKMDTSLEYGRHISKLIDELGIEKSEEKDE